MHQSSIIVMKDLPFVNAGVIFARPGSPEAQRLLDDVAWRVQLFQNHPEVIGRLVHYAREPYYANSDDQTLLSDCFLSAILGERTWLTSTARFEARMMKLEDKLDATAAGGGHAAARALEERLARIEETLRDVAARPSKNS